jgi:hypothetical protein
MSGETDVTVVTTLVCFFILHARLRARRAPGIPCALYWRVEENDCKTRAKSGCGIAKLCLERNTHSSCPGLTRASINLRNESFEGDGLPGKGERKRRRPSDGYARQ